LKQYKNIAKPISEQEQALLNVQQVLVDLRNDEPKLIQKIHKFAKMYGKSVQDVIKDLSTGNFIALERFAISPKRQGRSEQIVAYALDQDNDVIDFTRLPKRGKDSLYFDNGRLCDIKPETSHSLDFIVYTKKHTIYMSAKQTEDEGGAQNHQYNELKLFAIATNGFDTSIIKYGVIVEGRYYTDKRLRALLNLNSNFQVWRILDNYAIESISL
jgi:hypothetical protein